MLSLAQVLKSAISKPRLFASQPLTVGAVFAMGSRPGFSDDQGCRWRVCKISVFLGIPHALIEQTSSEKTKTVAVSAILRDRTFRPLKSNDDGESM